MAEKNKEEKKLQEDRKLFLNGFLDTVRLTRAERSFYEKQYKGLSGEEKTITEWNTIIKFVH